MLAVTLLLCDLVGLPVKHLLQHLLAILGEAQLGVHELLEVILEARAAETHHMVEVVLQAVHQPRHPSRLAGPTLAVDQDGKVLREVRVRLDPWYVDLHRALRPR